MQDFVTMIPLSMLMLAMPSQKNYIMFILSPILRQDSNNFAEQS